MMGHREQMVNGDEIDAFTGWRRMVTWTAGQRRRIKRAFNRRTRKLARRECAERQEKGQP